MKPNPDAAPLTPREPRLALTIATVLGVGHIPKSPGTFGSLVGILIAKASELTYVFPLWLIAKGYTKWSFPEFIDQLGVGDPTKVDHPSPLRLFVVPAVLAFVVIARLGLRAASRISKFAGIADPQYVVIDEVSGQHLALILGLAPFLYLPSGAMNLRPTGYALLAQSLLNWKYLLLGFILFRVFDIWKPFPVRQAEKLPGGWGIMADDWVAAVYAALGLWAARYLGL